MTFLPDFSQEDFVDIKSELQYKHDRTMKDPYIHAVQK